jgi:hypothetical protein
MMLCRGEEYYKNTISGVPIGFGKYLGGVYEKTEPKCDHDLSQIQMLKQESMKNAQNWRKIAYITSIFSFACLCLWYLTKIGQVAGIAVISIVFSLFSTFMASLVTMTWLFVLVFIAFLLIGLGIYLHKKSFFEWLKNRGK